MRSLRATLFPSLCLLPSPGQQRPTSSLWMLSSPHRGEQSQPGLAAYHLVHPAALEEARTQRLPTASNPQLLLTQFNVYLEVNGRLDFKIN